MTSTTPSVTFCTSCLMSSLVTCREREGRKRDRELRVGETEKEWEREEEGERWRQWQRRRKREGERGGEGGRGNERVCSMAISLV